MPNASLKIAPHGRGWLHYLLGVALHAGVFAALGPAIGAFAIGGVFAALVPWTLGIAYLSNVDAAALAGACVAVVSSFVTAPGRYYGMSAAIGGTTAVLLGSVGAQPQEPTGFLLLAVAGAVASAGCARVAKPLRLHPSNMFFSVQREGARATDARSGTASADSESQ